MADSFNTLLMRSRLGLSRSHRSVRTLYGDPSWTEDLDIVNELGGHSGCVNALSWSSSGNLLASGSDDTYLNIWERNPSDMARPFSLNTSVSTGHHANIFSVKFMPHSGDRTVVTCAGDSEVRVFDLEHAASAHIDPADHGFASSTRSRRFHDFFPNAKWLNESNTNARVYRSHADRAKRVVTESSPHLFLTCSEDGEVRQWDLRMPSSAYPPPRSVRGWSRYRRPPVQGSDNVPPPLISYKNYNLDLNSISCASSQPHYIALGGAHLHCFLHDRRMLGRNVDTEAGRPAGKTPDAGSFEDDAMGDATRCVRRFAPNEKRRMKTHDHGHITACKISDANPNEMVVSWSGDYIYSFDLVRSPDARDSDAQKDESFQAHRLRNRQDRKRKRKSATASSTSVAENGAPRRRLRRVSDQQEENGTTALQVRDGDETEQTPIASTNTSTDLSISETVLGDAQRLAEGIARSLVKLRKELFDFSATLSNDTTVAMEQSSELTPHTAKLTAALGQCCSLLSQMDDVIRDWSYPMDPTEDDVATQNTLRRNRQASWRFVQAAGCLSQTLGGRLQTLSSAPDPRLASFSTIRPAPNESKQISKASNFCYDFLKAILCWLAGGQAAVIKAFVRPSSIPLDCPRFPLKDSDPVEISLEKLGHYLANLASEEVPVVDLETNRFEIDERRHIFPTQTAALKAFCRALGGVELQQNQGSSEQSSRDSNMRVMDKGAAARFWGVRVGRSLLMQAAEGVNFDFVLRAFGGRVVRIERGVSETSLEEIEADETDRLMEHIDSIRNRQEPVEMADDASGSQTPVQLSITVDEAEDTATVNEETNEGDEEDGSSNDGRSDSEGEQVLSFFRHRIALGGSRKRASVNINVPYSSHSRVYRGHCNTRTVKDVNYYGLNDEYVVSGSDDGHFFIWDRKSGKIVNILKGDGEVVNVVQGHPYEPMIACSGIDSTVKIFGPGGESRERDRAFRGLDVANPGGSVHSSLRFGGRHRRARNPDDPTIDVEQDQQQQQQQQARGDDGDDDQLDEDEEEAKTVSAKGLRSRRALHEQYRITSSNDEERRTGLEDAFITEGRLAQLATALQQNLIGGVQITGNVGGATTLVVNEEDCSVGVFGHFSADFRPMYAR